MNVSVSRYGKLCNTDPHRECPHPPRAILTNGPDLPTMFGCTACGHVARFKAPRTCLRRIEQDIARDIARAIADAKLARRT